LIGISRKILKVLFRKNSFKFSIKSGVTKKVSDTDANNVKCPQQNNQAANVLIIDNDKKSVRFILETLANRGIHAYLVPNIKTAIDLLDRNLYDLIFTGIKLNLCAEPADQLQHNCGLLEKVRENSPELPVVMIADIKKRTPKKQKHTTAGSSQPDLLQFVTRTAIKVVNAGFCDFLIKPLDPEKIENLLDTLLPNHTISTVGYAEQGPQALYTIVGRSEKLLQTVNIAKKAAPTSAPVLICGESGTGKELISFLIHHHSKRTQGPYIRINCAALSDSLLESELFGHEKGAFTGAYARRKGRFEMAHGGTLLLDEITETPAKFQAKLLRVIEQQDFERVGGNDSIRVDVRIISTTNKDLLQEVAMGRFRRDLYYRLSGVKLVISPLRERTDDLPDLVWYFVNLYARQTQRRVTKLDPDMMEIFAKYHWPGNIRQLRNVVLTSLILGTGQTLSLADVSWIFDELQAHPLENTTSSSDTDASLSGLVGLPLENLERQAILETLQHTSGNRTKAAKILGISDRTLRDKIRRYHQEQSLQPV